jgi:hypothetical protein
MAWLIQAVTDAWVVVAVVAVHHFPLFPDD